MSAISEAAGTVGGGSTVRAAEAERFTAWVRPHLAAMANLAARLAGPADRDDVVQEALTRAWRKWDSYDAARGTPRVWLLAIAADRAGRTRRRRRDHVQLSELNAGGVAAPVDPTAVDIERALAALPPRMRMAVDCVYFVGLTVAEAAAVMGVAEGTVKSTLADARTRLRTLLEVKP